MVGSFPDVPAPRIPYDRDGSLVVGLTGTFGLSKTYTAAEAAEMNDEDVGSVPVGPGWNVGSGWLTIVFSEPKDLHGYAIAGQSTGSFAIQTSTDTTLGTDGTWTARGNATHTVPSSTAARTIAAFPTAPLLGVKGVRFFINEGPGAQGPASSYLALYGVSSSGASVDRLRFWHPTLDASLETAAYGAYFDLGDLKAGLTAVKTFRLRNTSATLTANTPSVVREVLSDLSPATLNEYSFSADGGTTWGAAGAALAVPTLAAGATSAVLAMRRVVPASPAIGVVQARLVAAATSWT